MAEQDNNIEADQDVVPVEGDVEIKHKSAADFEPVAALIDEAREKAGYKKGEPGVFMGYVKGVGFVVDL